MPCNKIDFVLGRQGTLALYPDCVAFYHGNDAARVIVEADFNSSDDPIALTGSLSITFGVAGWLALWIHAILIELYVSLSGKTKIHRPETDPSSYVSPQPRVSVYEQYHTSVNLSVASSFPALPVSWPKDSAMHILTNVLVMQQLSIKRSRMGRMKSSTMSKSTSRRRSEDHQHLR